MTYWRNLVNIIVHAYVRPAAVTVNIKAEKSFDLVKIWDLKCQVNVLNRNSNAKGKAGQAYGLLKGNHKMKPLKIIHMRSSSVKM